MKNKAYSFKQFFMKILPFNIFFFFVGFLGYFLKQSKGDEPLLLPLLLPLLILSLLILLIAVFVLFIYSGYTISCLKSMIKRENLPSVNFKRDFILGIKNIIGILIPSVVIIGLFAILIVMEAPKFYLGLFAVCFAIPAFIYLPALYCIFAKTEKILSFCRLIFATKLICKDIKAYILGLIAILLISLGIWLLQVLISYLVAIIFSGISIVISTTLISCIHIIADITYLYIFLSKASHMVATEYIDEQNKSE